MKLYSVRGVINHTDIPVDIFSQLMVIVNHLTKQQYPWVLVSVIADRAYGVVLTYEAINSVPNFAKHDVKKLMIYAGDKTWTMDIEKYGDQIYRAGLVWRILMLLHDSPIVIRRHLSHVVKKK